MNKTTALTRVTREAQRLGQELGREPTADEIAARLDLDAADVELVFAMPTKQFSIDDAVEGRDNDFHIETLSDEVTQAPDEAVMETTRSEDIDMALASLKPREADILRRYYGLGQEAHTLEEIGRVYSLTRERVRQIRDRAIWRLRNSNATSLLQEHSAN
jgi:RNA polymerase primary sigma factor